MARVVFLGTPEIAAVTLAALCREADLEVVGAITQPDRPAGRGRNLKASPVKVLAQELELSILQPQRVKGSSEAIDFLESNRPDVMVVVAFGQILPRVFFEWPDWGTLNVHTSLLPHYRGVAPVIRAIEAGETITGVTIMRINGGVDTGDLLSSQEVEIGPDETAGDLEARLAEVGARLLLKTLPRYLEGKLSPTPQDHQAANWAALVRKEEGRVDWEQPAQHIHNHVRAFNPRPGCFSSWRGGSVKILRTRAPESSPEPSAPGTVLPSTSGGLRISCGSGSRLEIVEIQPANRRRMEATDFVNGYAVVPGEFFR